MNKKKACLRVVSFFTLGPFLFYPFSFCPFRLPYLYCFVCPVRCGWGRIRGIILLIVLGLNVNRDTFCNHLCPMGIAQTFLFRLNSSKLVLPKFMHSLKYITLALIIIAVGVTLAPGMPEYNFIGMKDLFLLILLLGGIMSIFIYRLFCSSFCPIRALSNILKHGLTRMKNTD